jgi:capsular polysaccharide transport system permease protein
VSASAPRPLLIDGARQQLRVIGALILREMHTRFGRHRLGYLWLFFEPLLLGAAIALIHYRSGGAGDALRSSFEFFSIGYMLFFQFRGIINRAGATIPANLGLLYHRQVTLPDLFFARHLIEAVACTGVLCIFVVIGMALGGEAPASPVQMLSASGLMLLLAQGIALMVGAASAEWEGVERFVHAVSYLTLPIGGVFFMVAWLPDWLQELVLWVPTVHVFELLREGQFGDRVTAIYDLGYIAGWILVPHLLGLAALRITRRRIGLE